MICRCEDHPYSCGRLAQNMVGRFDLCGPCYTAGHDWRREYPSQAEALADDWPDGTDTIWIEDSDALTDHQREEDRYHGRI